MTTTDDLGADNVAADSDVHRRNSRKLKKISKKKRSESTNASLSPSTRNSGHNSQKKIPDDIGNSIVSPHSSDDGMDVKKILQEKTKLLRPKSPSTRIEDDDDDSHGNNNSCERKIQRSPKKIKNQKQKTDIGKKAKPTDSRGKRKKKKKKKKNQEEEESRNRIRLEDAVNRVSNPDMENLSELLLISGDSGVGKTYWIDSEINRILLEIRQDDYGKRDEEEDSGKLSNDCSANYYPVTCAGKCEIPPQIPNEIGDSSNENISKATSTLNSSMEFFSRGCGMSRPPMHAIAEALNNLIRLLTMNNGDYEGRERSNSTKIGNIYGGKLVWKKRIEDALGITEASYLASTGLVPELGFLLDLPGYSSVSASKKRSVSWDWNSPYKFHRLCLAIRDLLRAVSEFHHPVIMVLGNVHQADEDTYRLLKFLLTGDYWDEAKVSEPSNEHEQSGEIKYSEGIIAAETTSRLKNFLLIGLHEGNSKKQDDALKRLELSFIRRGKNSDEAQQIVQQNERDQEVEQVEQPHITSYLTKIHFEGFNREKVECFLRSQICNHKANMAKNEHSTGEFEEMLRDLAELIYEWTNGNIFYVCHVFEYLKEVGAITSSSASTWQIDKAQNEFRRWNKSTVGLMATRIDRLPKAVRSVLVYVSAFRQTQIEFSVQELFHLLNAAYAEMDKKKKSEFGFNFEYASDLKGVLDLACDSGFMKRVSCPHNDSNHRWAFAHTIIRDGAYSLFIKKKEKLEIHFRLGSKATTLASVPSSTEQERGDKGGDIYLSNIEHDVFKFLAADQLAIAEELLVKECKSLVMPFLETAQLCISKSAFCAAIHYLEVGISILERNGGRFTADNRGISLHIDILLARLHSVCDRNIDETDNAFHEILVNCKNLKDHIMLNKTRIAILISRNNYPEALKMILCTLELLGEKLPQKQESSKILPRQLKNLIQQTQRKDNQSLLKPVHCNSAKTFDLIALLSNLIETSHLCNNDAYEELAIIRMVNICLTSGFTSQYSMSFALYGEMLMERAFATNDFDIAKEGYRMGQICEKVASVNSFYGGYSLAIFHASISHWRRPYRRSLGHILSIYNAQLASGDYLHIQSSSFLIVQYHLTSGHDLMKLDDNLHLFNALYQDYNMENHWKIKFPQRFVSNMLGETSDPFLMVGNTIEDHDLRIQEMRDAGEIDAIELIHFLLLFTSIFFHNHELCKSCLEKIDKEKVLLIWKPWVLFFQCYSDIISLSTVEKKAEKKKLKEIIQEQRDRLLDWYNEGFVNFSFMISLIDAEYAATDTGDKKTLPTLRLKKFYDDAIAVAHDQGLKHIEAFCLERASMRFEANGADGLCAEYIAKARHSYIEWNAIAKIHDVEEKYASKLKLSKQEKIVGAGYVRRNSDMQYDPERKIGGGRKKIKAINMKGVAKTAGKVKNIALRRSFSRSPRAGAKGVLSSSRRPSLQHNLTNMASQKLITNPENDST
eukprot:CAMPEP_0197200392 /NCGR_PEP_ID=MMETSP1423-20130617/34370_1 /TAXON_ID=476441 /ORGANISM="Pseudo-nitzschia heimii, Strain UNC1101" /LENGTH=1460 /DNA_ID=CAMNT_0042654271 /DNA_START=91 /DNA_END=4473 /DNA_ORIENTATION=-